MHSQALVKSLGLELEISYSLSSPYSPHKEGSFPGIIINDRICLFIRKSASEITALKATNGLSTLHRTECPKKCIPWPSASVHLARTWLASLVQGKDLQKIRLWGHFVHAWGMTFFPTPGNPGDLQGFCASQPHGQLRVKRLNSHPFPISPNSKCRV